MFKEIKEKVKRLLGREVRYHQMHGDFGLEKLGSGYGGWIIPVKELHEHSICYLAGAGEDISFDIALVTRFKCPVFIFDPTPRAKDHFDKFVTRSLEEEDIVDYGEDRVEKKLLPYFRFFEVGLWETSGKLKFFAPKESSHISHSVSNLQGTSTYFEAAVQSLPDIMRSNGHASIDLLKMDIEGAEFNVINSILSEKLDIRVLCIEFHKKVNGNFEEIQEAIYKLEKYGYRVIARENLDFTFLKTENG